jgi:hypothetical protein
MSARPDPVGVVVHEVRWGDALPWWLLFRAAGAAFAPTVILLAAAGAVATWAGWSMADRMNLPGAAASRVADELVLPPAGPTRPAASLDAAGWREAVTASLPPVVADLARSVAVPFSPASTLRESGGAAARVGWFLLVWSIFGTAIARHVALRLVGEDAPGIFGATFFGSRQWLPAFNSVLFVLVGVLALSVPGGLLGLAMRTEWGLAFAGAVWPAVLLGAVVLAILVVGVVAGWPLMVACIGVERGDAFQAISTAFSYLYQRPLHYAFYAAVALALAIPALLVADLFAHATEALALWATSLGMGHDRTAAVLQGLTAAGPTADAWGVKAIAFWSRGLATLLASFGWGFFWAIATAAYLLLRRDVDGTELDEVVLDEPGGTAA